MYVCARVYIYILYRYVVFCRLYTHVHWRTTLLHSRVTTASKQASILAAPMYVCMYVCMYLVCKCNLVMGSPCHSVRSDLLSPHVCVLPIDYYYTLFLARFSLFMDENTIGITRKNTLGIFVKAFYINTLHALFHLWRVTNGKLQGLMSNNDLRTPFFPTYLGNFFNDIYLMRNPTPLVFQWLSFLVPRHHWQISLQVTSGTCFLWTVRP